MKIILLVFLIPGTLFAQKYSDFKPMDQGTSKLHRIENLEKGLSLSNEQTGQDNQVLLAQKSTILKIQKQINELVKIQQQNETTRAEEEKTSNKVPAEILERLDTLETSVKKIKAFKLNEMKKNIDEINLSLKTIQKLVEILEKKASSSN